MFRIPIAVSLVGLWLAAFLIAAAEAGAAQVTEDADPIELNPSDYVPLEVGNRWTYRHIYLNEAYKMSDILGERAPFIIPGYPLGDAPDSLRYAENIVTIEITHTEVINGFEYFVFSKADYAWPPFPTFFWAGKKVRLSDEGVLVFSWNEQDPPFYNVIDEAIAAAATANRWDERGFPFYDFGRPSAYTRTQARLSRVSFDFDYFVPVYLAGTVFLQGYGIGQVYMEQEYVGSCGAPVFRNELTPISAVISGREIVHEQVRPFYLSFESTGVGQIAPVRMGAGFDFSQGTHSEPSNDVELLELYVDYLEKIEDLDSLYFGGPSGKLACSPYEYITALRSSEAGVVNLGKVDFSRLISQGIPPDRPLDFATKWALLYEGHTYAVRSREGGVALLYVFDAEFNEEDYKPTPFFFPNLEHITFDWVYYPDGVPDKDTAVQPISWGQLKARHRQRP